MNMLSNHGVVFDTLQEDVILHIYQQLQAEFKEETPRKLGEYKEKDRSLYSASDQRPKRYDFDNSAYIDGASDMDKCIQVNFLLPDKENMTVVDIFGGL